MLGVVLNEEEIIKDILENGHIDNKPMKTIGTLIKYYHIQGKDKQEIKLNIIDFMKNNYKEFSINQWYSKINNAINTYHKYITKNKIEEKLTIIKDIPITQGELNNISALCDIRLERIAFVMLVYAKISNVIFNNDNCWINKSCAMICKEAKVSIKVGEKKELLFNKLYNQKYITKGNNNSKTTMKINYMDNNSPTVIKITKFDEVIYYYLKYKGLDYIKCKNCDKYIKHKNNKTQYCKKCAREINIKKTIENRKKRNV